MVEQSRLGGVLKGGRGATSEGEWGELGLWGAGVVPAVEGDWRGDRFVAVRWVFGIVGSILSNVGECERWGVFCKLDSRRRRFDQSEA